MTTVTITKGPSHCGHYMKNWKRATNLKKNTSSLKKLYTLTSFVKRYSSWVKVSNLWNTMAFHWLSFLMVISHNTSQNNSFNIWIYSFVEESLNENKKSVRAKNQRKTTQLTLPLKPMYEFFCFTNHSRSFLQKW